MAEYTKEELLEAVRAIESTICKCEKVLPKLPEGKSQHTLLVRRIKAFEISVSLINAEIRRNNPMLNYEVFNKDNQPTESEIKDFVGTELFSDLDNHLRDNYKIKPKLSYSGCAMDNNVWRGWNIKYQKSGKSLCTIYPQQGYFLVLVPGKSFEVRNQDTIIEIKHALEIRNEEMSAKKKVQ